MCSSQWQLPSATEKQTNILRVPSFNKLLNRTAIYGWAVSCSAFSLLNRASGLFFKPRSHIWLSSFLLCLRFIKPRKRFLSLLAVYFFFSFVCDQTQTSSARSSLVSSPDDVMMPNYIPFLSCFLHASPQESSYLRALLLAFLHNFFSPFFSWEGMFLFYFIAFFEV